MGWQPRFTAAYTHVSGGARISDNLDISLAAVLTAQSLNVGWGPVISPGVQALTRSRIGHVYQNYVRAENHAAANAALIAGQAGIATVQLWGGGLVAAVDGTRFVVPVRSIDARPNPKYFGRRKGTTLLGMINDQGVGVAGMVLSGTPRDSLYAVDLMYRRDGGPRPEVFISDTGSYSDMVFGLLRLLGVAYRPELADLPDQKLWRANPTADYGPLDRAARGKIDLSRVNRHWPDLVRVAASVHSGAISASDVMRMLQRGGNPTQLGDALAHFGRIFKPCTYWPTSIPSPTGATSNACATCRRNATAWPSTSSTAARASCGRRTTPEWRTSSALWAWSPTASRCGIPSIST